MRSLFHKGAFVDALKKLIIPAIIIVLSITMIECVYINMVDISPEDSGGLRYAKENFERLAFPYLFSFLIASPILMVYCFRYQNDRVMADSFHSLPIKRKSLAFSNTAAILIIDAFILAFGCLLVKGAGMVIPGIHLEHAENTGLLFGWYIAATVYSTAMILLTISIGGTWVSSLCMYWILMVVPGALIENWERCVLENSNCIMNGFRGTLLDWRLNAATSVVNSFLYDEDYYTVKSVSGIVFTMVLGILLFVLALLLFEKRTSEIAGRPAASDRLHRIFRYLLGGTILCYLFSAEEDLRLFNHTYNEKLLILLVAIFLYFLYEYLINKSRRSCIRAIPGLLFVALFSAVFYGTTMIGKHVITSVLPTTDRVHSVRITNIDGQDAYRYSGGDYYTTKLFEYTIKDPEAIEILCEAVSKTEKQGLTNGRLGPVLRKNLFRKLNGLGCEDDNHIRIIIGGEMDPEVVNFFELPIRDDIVYENRETWMILSFDGWPLFSERKVHLDQDDLSKWISVLEKDVAFRDIFLKPESREFVDFIEVTGNSLSQSRPQGDTDELYKIYADAITRYSEEAFSGVVYREIGIYPSGGTGMKMFCWGDASMRVMLEDGTYQWIHLQGADSDPWYYSYIKKEDALVEAYKDVFLTSARDKMTELSKGSACIEAIITVDFYNMTSGSGNVRGQMSWCTHLVFDDKHLTFDVGNWNAVNTNDALWEETIWALAKRTRYWNGWEVTDTSAPYAKVTYTVNQQMNPNEEFRCLKKYETEYRLEPEVCEWIANGAILKE